MKRLTLAWIVLVAVTASGCGQYAFFRDPAEQMAINRAYDEQVMSKQGMSSSAVGATTGSAGGEVSSEWWHQ